MANIGIATPEAVAEAADKLLAAGQNPSVALVRERLEGGSPNTINKHLNAWRQQLGQRFLALQRSDDVPIPLREGMLALWTLALDHAQTQATKELAGERSALDRDQAALTKEREAMAAREQALQQENRQLTQSLKDAGERATQREADHAKQTDQLRQELAQARTAAAEHQARTTALSAENGRLSAAVDALDTRLKERQEAEDQQHAADLARLDEAAQTIKQLKASLGEAARERQAAQKTLQTAEQRCQTLQQAHAVLAEKLKGLEAHQAVLVDQLTASRADLARLASKPRKRRSRSSKRQDRDA